MTPREKPKGTGEFIVRGIDLELRQRAIDAARADGRTLTWVVIRLIELWADGKVKL